MRIKLKLIIGWIATIPISWAITTNETITGGGEALKILGYGAIGFIIGIMTASSITVYLERNRSNARNSS